MLLIDTHTHLYDSKFNEDRSQAIKKAIDEGVERMYMPNIDKGTIDGMLALEVEFPDHCFAMMGLHPCSVKEDYEEELQIVRSWLDRRSFKAVGEIGIDLYWDKTFVKEQETAFLRQVEWAIEFDLPIVIHSRESIDEILSLLQPIKDPKLRGIFHCFTGNLQQANAIIDLGFLMGIGGVLTFKKSGLDKVLEEVDLRHLVLETDAPYLAPTPHRGKRNESAYVNLVAEKLAQVHGVTKTEVAKITSANALALFGDVL